MAVQGTRLAQLSGLKPAMLTSSVQPVVACYTTSLASQLDYDTTMLRVCTLVEFLQCGTAWLCRRDILLTHHVSSTHCISQYSEDTLGTHSIERIEYNVMMLITVELYCRNHMVTLCLGAN